MKVLNSNEYSICFYEPLVELEVSLTSLMSIMSSWYSNLSSPAAIRCNHAWAAAFALRWASNVCSVDWERLDLSLAWEVSVRKLISSATSDICGIATNCSSWEVVWCLDKEDRAFYTLNLSGIVCAKWCSGSSPGRPTVRNTIRSATGNGTTHRVPTMSDQIKELLDVPREFIKDGIFFLNRCTKPTKRGTLITVTANRNSAIRR